MGLPAKYPTLDVERTREELVNHETQVKSSVLGCAKTRSAVYCNKDHLLGHVFVLQL